MKIYSGNSENVGSENARLTLLSFWAPSMGVRTKKSFVHNLATETHLKVSVFSL